MPLTIFNFRLAGLSKWEPKLPFELLNWQKFTLGVESRVGLLCARMRRQSSSRNSTIPRTELLQPLTAACGTSRHFLAMQQFSRFRSEADIRGLR